MTGSTSFQCLIVSFAVTGLMSHVFVIGCSSSGITNDVDLMVSDTLIDSSTMNDAVDTVVDDSGDGSDNILIDSGAGDEVAMDSEAPDVMTDVHDAFVDADDVMHLNDMEVSSEMDTHQIECVTGPYCAADNDCPSFDGKHCNLALDPPQCQSLYCGDVFSPCSEDALCASRVCFNDQCCQLDCDDRECGDDGCGGSCGGCTGEGSYCTEGHCCMPECGFRECGPDPVCGVECGPCPEGFACMTDSRCFDVADMAYVDAGSFWMGCNTEVDSKCLSSEMPYHLVTLSAYYIDRTEVTIGMYAECVMDGYCTEPSIGSEQCNWGIVDRVNFPVNCVTWDQARTFCAWAGKRMPTEAEWEKAARGMDCRKYPWGDEDVSCDYAVMDDGGGVGCGMGSTWNVCSKSPAGDSPYGLCDMAGNVAEWLSDWYGSEYYGNSPATNPTGAVSGSSRSARGGSFVDNGVILRASNRNAYTSSDVHGYLGFRCAKGGVSGELCDGIDNDLDGLTDENFKYADWDNTEKAVGDDCGTGACAGGTVVCSKDRSYALCTTSDLASTEILNDIDDDCNGIVEKCPYFVDCSNRECGLDPICGMSCGECGGSDGCINGQCGWVSGNYTKNCGANGMCLIPAGPFWMGCNRTVDANCKESYLYRDEDPYHKVILSAYYIDRSEVTQGQYSKCVAAGVCGEPQTDYEPLDKPKRPVMRVSWYDAFDYCSWVGKRLPTEAEWEKAARGTDGRKYPWGNQNATCEFAVFDLGADGCGTGETWDVCSKSPAGDSPYGLCDMAGNVYEWVSDWVNYEDYYAVSPIQDPIGPDSGWAKIKRGGGYWHFAERDSGGYYFSLRVSHRIFDDIYTSNAPIGFRCVKDAN